MSEIEKKKREPVCQRCNQAETNLITITNGRYSLLCRECDKARRERLVRERRKIRERRAASLRNEIERVIPKAFQKARLHHLGSRFKKMLLTYHLAMGVVLYGPTGTGKTYSLCALLRKLVVSGLKCKRIGYEMLCLRIRDSFKSGSVASELDIVKEYIEADVLLLEDLGCSKPIGRAETDFSLRVIYALLDSRLENERLTLISTNKTLENMKISFDERIASRLGVLIWIGVGGKDKRAVGTEL